MLDISECVLEYDVHQCAVVIVNFKNFYAYDIDHSLNISYEHPLYSVFV